MPAAHAGFGSVFLPGGYPLPVLACPPQPHPGLPVTYPGLQYSFLAYPPHRSLAHLGGGFDMKGPQYQHALLARGAAFLPPYRPAAPEELGRVAKAATRESTGALKAWLSAHLKNPYPTKGEKVMLAIVTRMSLTQVSTWFANARRRLKKENRVSWGSKGGEEEEEDEEEEEEEEEGERVRDAAPVECVERTGSEPTHPDTRSALSHKPKIWSLAETATSQRDEKPATVWADWTDRNRLCVPTRCTAPEPV